MTKGHRVIEQDSTPYSSVIVCECGQRFLGVGPSPRADVREVWTIHKNAHRERSAVSIVPPPKRGPRTRSDSLLAGDELILERLRAGDGVHAIASALHVSFKRIKNVRDAAGIPANPGGFAKRSRNEAA